MEITRLDTHSKIVDAVRSAKLPFIFFATPEMLNTFFNKKNFALYAISEGTNTYLFVQKEHTKELRLLFADFPESAIAQLRETFNPPYIAYNELAQNPEKEHQVVATEVVVDLEKYISLADKTIRKQYHQAQKYNHLTFKEFKNIPRSDIEQFLNDWAQMKQTQHPLFSYTLENDRNFFDKYTEDDFWGIAVYDDKKLVGYSIAIAIGTQNCVSAFNKCLRGYRNLGLQISIEKARMAYKKGYTHMNIGTINNDFKKHLLPIATTHHLYSYEFWRNENFKTKSPHGYTDVLFF